MRPASLAFFFLLALSVPSSARASAPDPWLGPDKGLHFGVSALLASGGYAASSQVLARPWDRAMAAGTLSLALGAGKELYDLSGRGDPSWKDLTWDALGTLTGVGLSLLLDWISLDGRSPFATDARWL